MGVLLAKRVVSFDHEPLQMVNLDASRKRSQDSRSMAASSFAPLSAYSRSGASGRSSLWTKLLRFPDLSLARSIEFVGIRDVEFVAGPSEESTPKRSGRKDPLPPPPPSGDEPVLDLSMCTFDRNYISARAISCVRGVGLCKVCRRFWSLKTTT